MGFLASLKHYVSEQKEKKPDFHSQYRLEKKLGEGGFATVYTCVSRLKELESAKTHAVKIFDVKSSTESASTIRKDFRLEVQIMQQIGRHPNCVQVHVAFEDSRFCYLIMEKCSCNILDAFLAKRHATERELAQAFSSLLRAVDHLHSVRVVHRDIKPCNILLKDGQRDEHLDVKICDMGLAAMMPQENSAKKRCGCIPVKNGLTEICGTTPYMAPEMLQAKRPYTELVDEWSSGVTMYVLLFGEFPYKVHRKDLDLMKEAIIAGRMTPSFQAHTGLPQPSSLACDLVAALMSRDIECRPNAAEALNHPFLQSLVPKSMPPSKGSDTFVIPRAETPTDKSISPNEMRERSRLPSLHPTLLHAKTLLKEHEECTPLEKKRSIEQALESLQKEKGLRWQRNSSRCRSEPSLRQHSSNELQRLPARLSTHSGLSIASKLIEEDANVEGELDILLPGTPSTTDGGSEC